MNGETDMTTLEATKPVKAKRVSKPKATTPKAPKAKASITSTEPATPFYGKLIEHTKGDGKKVPDRLAPLGSDFPKKVDGRFPFAILHEARKAGIEAAKVLTVKLNGWGGQLGDVLAKNYVEACILANGDPNKRMV